MKTDIPNRYYRFAEAALDLAAINENDMTHSLCAFIVRKNKVLSVGYNSRKTNTIAKHYKMQMTHAECHAIIRCPENEIKGSTLIVVRARPSGKPGTARPCINCSKVIKDSGIKQVFYTTTNDEVILENIKY